MRAGCDPTRRRSRQGRIGGGEGLRRRAGAVENERRRRVEILGEKTGILLFLRLLDKILQIAFMAGAAAAMISALTPPRRTAFTMSAM